MIAIEVKNPIVENQVVDKILSVNPSILTQIIFFRNFASNLPLKNNLESSNSSFYSVADSPREITHILAFSKLENLDAFIKNWNTKYSFESSQNYIINSKLSPGNEIKILSRLKYFKYFSLYMKEEAVLVDIKNKHIFDAKNAKQMSLLQKLAHFSKRDQRFAISSEFIDEIKFQRTGIQANQKGLLKRIKKGKDFWIGTIFPTVSALAVNQGYLNFYSRLFVRLKTLNVFSFALILLILPHEKGKFAWSYIYQLGQTILRPAYKAKILNYLRKNKRIELDLSVSNSVSTFNQITMRRSENLNRISATHNFSIDDEFLDSFSNGFKNTGTPTVVVFCLDDYSSNIGGVQLYLDLESRKVQEMGGNYIAVYPTKYSLRLQENVPMEIMLNQQRVGQLSSQYITNLLDLIQESMLNSAEEMIIGFHALLGHDVKSIVGALTRRQRYSGYFYVHDYYSICPSVKLMRNDWVFCGAPPPTSNSCKVCVYGIERQTHQKEISKIIDLEKITVIAPSYAAAEIWSEANSSKRECKVFPHAVLKENPSVQAIHAPNVKPKIAYIGYTNRAKGWDSFYEYFQASMDDELEFYIFSRDNPRIKGIKHVELLNTGRNPSECTKLLKENGIDYVFIWPEWPETFSYVTLEAIAAGCQVVTNKHSGNVHKLATEYNAIISPATLQDCQREILEHWSRNKLNGHSHQQYQVVHRNYLLEHLHDELGDVN